MSEYKIKLEAFEGPMDLLMHLIEKNKINIYDIPIAEVTEQYLTYLEQFKEFNIEVASEFLVMVATLLQIKSRILLPKPKKINEDEDDSELDPRQELVDRLLEYRRFKEVSEVLDQLAADRSKMFFREPEQLLTQYIALEWLDVNLLVTAFNAVLEANVDNVTLVSREKFSVQDKMMHIMVLLHKSKQGILFTDAFTRAGTKAELVVTFLALLELIKLKRVLIEQKYSFAPICIKAKDVIA